MANLDKTKFEQAALDALLYLSAPVGTVTEQERVDRALAALSLLKDMIGERDTLLEEFADWVTRAKAADLGYLFGPCDNPIPSSTSAKATQK